MRYLSAATRCYIIPGIPPPIPPGIPPGVSSLISIKAHSVVKIIPATEAAFSNAIHTGIAAVGHDTKDLKATDEAYATVHPCCEYRDEEVKDDHKE
ncbi:hypothetical protein [Lacinutrix sp. MEBiC02595]